MKKVRKSKRLTGYHYNIHIMEVTEGGEREKNRKIFF